MSSLLKSLRGSSGAVAAFLVALVIAISVFYAWIAWMVADYVTKELLVVSSDYRLPIWLFVFIASSNLIFSNYANNKED